MSLEAMNRWFRERLATSRALEADEEEERSKKEKEEEFCLAQLHKMKQIQAAEHEREVEDVEGSYAQLSNKERECTSPLLLDSVVTPLSEPPCTCNDVVGAKCKQLIYNSARHERDQAKLLARQYRDLAEECQAEKRRLKQELEQRVETVRNFWRNQIVEGGSRAGRVLRSSLIRTNTYTS